MKILLMLLGLLLLIGSEILRVYFIMPFPGSQESETIRIAYWLHNNIGWIRIVALALLAYPVFHIFKNSVRWKKITTVAVLIFYGIIFFFFNFRAQADKMFYQPKHKYLFNSAENKVDPAKLVIGVTLNGEAKAYPIQIIGYHHQVRDTVGNTPIMVTYCTVCRTGRIFSPTVNGKPETFRLVGMDHFNAMFEDATTKSWWRQSTGEAIAGPLTGSSLPELPSRQSTLGAWLREYPNSTILNPDSSFTKDYEDLSLFDNGTIKSGLEKRDSASWEKKSWVIGINHGTPKAYDWNQLVKETVIQDSLPYLPVILFLEKDTVNFHVWNRTVGGVALQFEKIVQPDQLVDRNTGSIWNTEGLCTEGTYKGKQLQPIQAYQEFWHSWKSFHPNTVRL